MSTEQDRGEYWEPPMAISLPFSVIKSIFIWLRSYLFLICVFSSTTLYAQSATPTASESASPSPSVSPSPSASPTPTATPPPGGWYDRFLLRKNWTSW